MGLIPLSVVRHHVQCLTFHLVALPGVVPQYHRMIVVTTDPQEIRGIADQHPQGTLDLQLSDQEMGRCRVDLPHHHVVPRYHEAHPMVVPLGADLVGSNHVVGLLIAGSLVTTIRTQLLRQMPLRCSKGHQSPLSIAFETHTAM